MNDASSTSQVYFTTMRIPHGDSIPKKLKRLVQAAGLSNCDLDEKYVAIKTHVGELGNVTHLKPEYSRAIAEFVKDMGGKPFVTDTCTLYPGMRSNALDHLKCAAMNGFNSLSCGCEIIPGDGLRGTDYALLPVPHGTLLENAYIGRAIADADFLIMLTHAKGCAASSFGGTLKNLSMGCSSLGGKLVMHGKGDAQVLQDRCIGCGVCVPECGQNAIHIVDGKAYIDEHCAGCAHCLTYCKQKAIKRTSNDNFDDLQMKMAEYASAVVASKPCFYVAIAIDITPYCDCFVDADAPMVPNIGMFASFDPVALDQAITDAINDQPMNQNGPLPELHQEAGGDEDHLHAVNPQSDWTICLEHAEKIGVGSRSYELVEVK